MYGDVTVFSAVILSTILMGLSCGTGCSPAIGALLSSYVLNLDGNTKKSVKTFILFFVGKMIAILLVCIISSLIGTMFVEEKGYFGKYKTDMLMPVFLIINGIYMMIKIYKEYKNKGCNSCKKNCSNNEKYYSVSPFAGGFLYGLTPCMPLIIISGYAINLSLIKGIILGMIFSIASAFSPIIIILVIMKLLAVNMIKDTPYSYKIVRIMISIFLIIIGTKLLI